MLNGMSGEHGDIHSTDYHQIPVSDFAEVKSYYP